MSDYAYELDGQGRRVLTGLNAEETTEFELLEAQLPMYAAELRWLELFNKHDHARQERERDRERVSARATRPSRRYRPGFRKALVRSSPPSLNFRQDAGRQ